jgi:alpha-mannosidase
MEFIKMKYEMKYLAAKGLIITIVFGIYTSANAEITHGPTQKEINISLTKWGAVATASSEYGMNCLADKALNGKWSSRDTDKWTSAHNKAPHWLCIDLQNTYEINKAVIRHEGACGEGWEFNTSDYRLQRSDLPDGPWIDLIEPVRGNTQDVTSHEFAAVRTRYVRLFIEKAEQNSNQCARIFAVEIYTPISRINRSLLRLEFPDKKFRKKDGQLETSARVEYIISNDIAVGTGHFFLKFADTQIEITDEKPRVLWLPATGEPMDVILLAKAADRETELTRTNVITPLPNYFSDGGTVHIMASSHQDIAWMDSPQFCRIWRDQHNVTPALDLMRIKKDYRFTVESMMYLMDELEDHPERREQVHQYTKEGLLEWGATYTQPYESMLSGEQMVRGMYLGRKWLHKTFPDCDSLVAWSPDVPGRAMQMPQILSKAGISYLMFSRHEPGLYNWESPDGSGVIAYTPGHYCESGREIFMVEAEEGANEVHRRLESDSDYFRKYRISPNYPLLRSWDFSPAAELPELINAIVSPEEEQAGGEQHSSTASGLTVRYSSSREFFESVKESKPSLQTIVGERPNPWLYIHGPSHHWAISASRQAGILLPAAEIFSTIQCVLDGSFESYPTREFFESWKAACFPDHGWGGNKGEITDALFKEKLEYARDKGQQLLDRSLNAVASHVKTDEAKGMPLVVFNTLSWRRSGVVQAHVPLTGDIHVTDSGGQVVPHQILSSNENENNIILFIAEEVPSTGYKTYYVVPGRKDLKTQNPSGSQDVLENRFYRLILAEGGVQSIYDKQLNLEILRPDKFLGGEVFTMQSVGNGAGEFADVQQPSMEGFDKVSSHRPKWTFNESETGPVQTVWNLRQKLKQCTVQQTLRLYNDIKKIDFEVSLLNWDGTQSREFRMALPVNADQANIAYEVAMGVLEVGKSEIEGAAGERYVTPCKDVHPREVLNFMTAGNRDFGVTMSSCVAVFDWMDPTADPIGCPVLQPILLASRKSCHGQGNWYLQAGDHHYRFSVLSHKSDWKSGYRFGIESNTPLQIAAGVKSLPKAELPEEKSFFEVSPDNVVVSTIKKCEDDNTLIVRLCDVEGKDSEITLNTYFSMAAAEHTNIIEEDAKAIPVSNKLLKTKIGHHAIETFKLFPDEMK